MTLITVPAHGVGQSCCIRYIQFRASQFQIISTFLAQDAFLLGLVFRDVPFSNLNYRK